MQNASNPALNPVVVNDPRLADQLKTPLGETVSWAKATPSVGKHLSRKAVAA